MEERLRLVLEVLGAISVLCTALAPFFPKGSKIGYALAKVGADVKGHTKETLTAEQAAILKKKPEANDAS